MNEDMRQGWVNEVLDAIFEALAARPGLRAILIFKGARVLHRRLGAAPRQSYDIDANLTRHFVEQHPNRSDQRRAIAAEFTAAIDGYFETQAVVRLKLAGVSVKDSPHDEHPLGWNAFAVRIRVDDRSKPGTSSLPALKIDVAAPETLSPASTAALPVGQSTVSAYTLPRIAGEKGRAFLSSLPAYRAKVKRPGDAVRAKDVYDLSRIVAARPLADEEFWVTVAAEFRMACESRFIDCAGLGTFEEQLEVTAAAYQADVSIPKDVPFGEAWGALVSVVRFFERTGVVPFVFPLPGERT